MMRNPTVSIQGIMNPSSYSMPKPPNVTIDTGDGRTRTVHLNRCKIHQFQGGSSTPLVVMTSLGHTSRTDHLSKVKIRIDTDSVMNLRRGIEVHLNRCKSARTMDNSHRTDCPKAPTLQRNTSQTLKGDFWQKSKHDNCGSVPMCSM